MNDFVQCLALGVLGLVTLLNARQIYLHTKRSHRGWGEEQYRVLVEEIRQLKRETRNMAGRLSQKLDEIESQISELTTGEAEEDATAAANVEKIAALEQQIRDLEAREVVTPELEERVEGLKTRLAAIKAGQAPPPAPEG